MYLDAFYHEGLKKTHHSADMPTTVSPTLHANPTEWTCQNTNAHNVCII